MVRHFLLPALALWVIPGCSGFAVEPDTSATNPPGHGLESEDPIPTSVEEAVDTYLALWEEIVVASAEMDPHHPGLEQHAIGQALELARLGVEGVAEEGDGMTGSPEPRPEVVSVSTSRVEIEDCQGAGDWTVVGAEEPEADNVLINATVTKDVFDWWVTEMRIWGEESC